MKKKEKKGEYKKNKKYIFSALAICLVVAISAMPIAIAEAANTVSIEDVTLAQGASEDVPIRLLNSTGVGGGSVTLTFDPTIVNVTNVVAGDFDTLFNVEYAYLSDGKVIITAMKSGQDLTGDLTFATVTLHAVGSSGSCELGLTAELTTKAGAPVSASVHNGTFTIPITYNLTVTSTEGGNVTVPGEGTFTYNESEVVDLKAVPDAGYRFVNWTGDVGTIANVSAPETNITMNDNYTITANFARITYTLTMAVSGNGTVEPSAGEHTYYSGDVVSINAIPDAGWAFVNWTTADMTEIADSTVNETTVTIDKSKTVTANFAILVVHDINVTWIKIIHDTTEIPEGDNLTIGETYKIKYRVNNDGNFDEPEVNITVKLDNDTWETTLREHTASINAGSGGTYTINSWDTTGLTTAGDYNITVNASIANDAHPENNVRTRDVTLVAAPPVDKTAPRTTVTAPELPTEPSPIPSGHVLNWTNKTVMLSFHRSDNGGDTVSGVNYTVYKIGAAAWKSEPGEEDFTVNVSAEGSTTVLYYSVDNEGNNESEELGYIPNMTVRIDKNAPTIEFIPPTPENGTTVNTSYVNVTVKVVDEISGVVNVLLNWNGENETMYAIAPSIYSMNKTNLSSGNYTYKVYANDRVENIEVSETRVVTVNVGLPKTGDMDGDGEVTFDDALRLARHVLASELYPLHADGNVDSVDDVNFDDALYLARYAIAPGIYPLYP